MGIHIGDKVDSTAISTGGRNDIIGISMYRRLGR